MTGRVRMVLMLLWPGLLHAETLKVWPGAGFLTPTSRPCGESTREVLKVIVNKTPMFTVRGSYVSVIVENYAGNFYGKPANRVLEGVKFHDGTIRTYGFWDEKENGTFAIAVAESGTKRPITLVIIKRQNCWEQWVGIAEVQ